MTKLYCSTCKKYTPYKIVSEIKAYCIECKTVYGNGLPADDVQDFLDALNKRQESEDRGNE